MKIRIAEQRDVNRLLEIYNYEILNSTATFAIRAKTLEEWETWFQEHNRNHHPLIVAEEGQEVAGYASLSEFRPGDAYGRTVELSVYVEKAYRGKRIGEKLMEEILRMAREDDGIHMVISVITSENEASIRLHKKLGFRYCGTWKEAGQKFGKWLDVDQYQLIV